MSACDDAVSESFGTALDCLIEAGATCVPITIDGILREMAEILAEVPIVAVEAAAIHAAYLDSRAAEFDPRIRERILLGRNILPDCYRQALQRRSSLIVEMDILLSGLDGMILPAVPCVAPLIRPMMDDPALFHRLNAVLLRNTAPANQFDLPAVSLPVPGKNGIGFMIVGRQGRDRALLDLAGVVGPIIGKHRHG
jgi:aspartyl-tRNA(Asn)/glutamyl-tRNA(Gln) amidotransferase subunit A